MPVIDDDRGNGDLLLTGQFSRLTEEDSPLLPTTGQQGALLADDAGGPSQSPSDGVNPEQAGHL